MTETPVLPRYIKRLDTGRLVTVSRSSPISIRHSQPSVATPFECWPARLLRDMAGVLNLTRRTSAPRAISLTTLDLTAPTYRAQPQALPDAVTIPVPSNSNTTVREEHHHGNDAPGHSPELIDRQTPREHDGPTRLSGDTTVPTDVSDETAPARQLDTPLVINTNKSITVTDSDTNFRTVRGRTDIKTSSQLNVHTHGASDEADVAESFQPVSSRQIPNTTDSERAADDGQSLQWRIDDPSLPSQQPPVHAEGTTEDSDDFTGLIPRRDSPDIPHDKDSPAPSHGPNLHGEREHSHSQAPDLQRSPSQLTIQGRATIANTRSRSSFESDEPRLTVRSQASKEADTRSTIKQTQSSATTTPSDQSTSPETPAPTNHQMGRSERTQDSQERHETDPITLLRSGGRRRSEFVEELHRALERKRAIERKRRGR